MMTRYILILVLIITLASSVGCREQVISTVPPTASINTPISSAPPPTVTSAITLTILPTPTFTPPRVPPTPSADSTPTPTSTTAPTPLVVTTWSTFTYDINPPQILIDYPTGWDSRVIDYTPNPDQLLWAQFHPPGESNQQISIHSYRINQAAEKEDSGWVEYLWNRPIVIKDATGTMSLYHTPLGYSLGTTFYSDKYNLKIGISFDGYVDPAILQSPSITDTISQQYGVYEHIVESVRLTEP